MEAALVAVVLGEDLAGVAVVGDLEDLVEASVGAAEQVEGFNTLTSSVVSQKYL
jgi:hypothetical protein